MNNKLKELSEIPSFAGRIKFCEKEFERISSGSSRKVYDLGDGNVLKLASNKKGLPQNSTESDYIFCDMFPDQVNAPIDHCHEGYWVVAKKLEPVKNKDITEFFGAGWKDMCSLFKKLDLYLLYPYKHSFPDIPETTKESGDRLSDLSSMFGDSELIAGDLMKASSYGKDPDTGAIKILDFGLTKETFIKHYRPNTSNSFAY